MQKVRKRGPTRHVAHAAGYEWRRGRGLTRNRAPARSADCGLEQKTNCAAHEKTPRRLGSTRRKWQWVLLRKESVRVCRFHARGCCAHCAASVSGCLPARCKPAGRCQMKNSPGTKAQRVRMKCRSPAVSGGAGAGAGAVSGAAGAGVDAGGATLGAAQAGFWPPQTSLLQVSHSQTHFSPTFFDDFFGTLMQRDSAQLLIPRAARRPLSSPPSSQEFPQPAPYRRVGVQAPLVQEPLAPQLSPPQTPSQGLGSQGNRVGGMQMVFVSML